MSIDKITYSSASATRNNGPQGSPQGLRVLGKAFVKRVEGLFLISDEGRLVLTNAKKAYFTRKKRTKGANLKPVLKVLSPRL